MKIIYILAPNKTFTPQSSVERRSDQLTFTFNQLIYELSGSALRKRLPSAKCSHVLRMHDFGQCKQTNAFK